MSITEETPPETTEAAIKRLAKLSDIEYEKVRISEAEKLGTGFRVSKLDELVRKEKGITGDKSDSVVEELKPYQCSVNGHDLLDDMANQLTDHVILPKGSAVALATWVLGSYALDAWSIWPKLLISSPEKRCGKTLLLEALEGLTYKPLFASSITTSAIFRSIEAFSPTLIIDEADTFMADNSELNGIINAGHRKRAANVIRSERNGDTFTPKKFNVWCPMIIAGIGKQKDTLQDRSIKIEMRRKLPGENAKRMPSDFYERSQTLRRKCLRWAKDNLANLKQFRPNVPACGNNRAEDNWLPLFAVAHVVGGQWPDKILASYQAFTAQDLDDETIGSKLLSDIKEIFEDRNIQNISSRDLITALNDMEDRPWCEWKHGKPLTQNSLSKLLNPYKIKTKSIRLAGKVSRGFSRELFEKTWERYLTPPISPGQSATVLQATSHAGYSQIQSATDSKGVALQKPLQAPSHAGCSTVALQTGDIDEWEAEYWQ